MEETKKKSIFNYFKNRTKKEMLAWTACTYVAYFIITILAPVLTILVNYDVFNAETTTKVKLGVSAVVLLIVVAVVGLFFIKRTLEKLNDIHEGVAIFKYSLETVSNVILPVIILVALYFLNIDFDRAKTTILTIMILYIAGGILDGTLINIISRENRIRDKALLDKEASERASNV